MTYALYSVGYLFLLVVAFLAHKQPTAPDRLLFITLALVPLGKLVYFPVPLLMGFKFCFLFLCCALAFLAIRSIYCRDAIQAKFLFPLAFMLPAAVSLPFLQYPGMLIWYRFGEEQADSVLARFISFFVLVLFCCWVAGFVARHRDGFRTIAVIYSNALLFACLVGYVIFVLVYFGRLTIEDLLPISADTHFIGNIYRFNPGANVNEFGMLLGYGMLFVMWLDWSRFRKSLYLVAFFLAEFLGLTRAAWIGVALGLFVYLVMAKKRRLKVFLAIGVLFGLLLLLASLNPEFSALLVSRTVLDIGVSGADRLAKFAFAYNQLTSSPWRLLFGFGWSTDLYIHSVPLQLIYETGLVGFFAFLLIGAVAVMQYLRALPGTDKSLLIPLMAMMFIFASVHHTLYHMQSWLIIGLFWGICVRNAPADQRSLGVLRPADVPA